MVQVSSADLTGKLNSFGPLQFVRVEWWEEAPCFALLRYSMDGREEPYGLRLDLDKRAILDSVENSYLDEAIRRQATVIWEAVIEARTAERRE